MRVRVRFTKLGKLRWTSHRDVARMWERAVRRVGLPLAWTEGFSPRPRISFGLALPTGHESVAEYLDLELAEPLRETGSAAGLAGPPAAGPSPAGPPPAGPLDDLAAALGAALPDGMDVLAVAPVEPCSGSLQEEVTSCTWQIEILGLDHRRAADLVERGLGAATLPVVRERKGRPITDDIRPSLRSLTPLDRLSGARSGRVTTTPRTGQDTNAVLSAELLTHPRGVRPSELLRALGPDLELGRALRTHQWIERDGARREPLPLGPPDAPHAYERAS